MNRKEIERIAVIKNGTKEVGYMDENKNFVTCDDMLNHLAIDVFQSICEIRSGEKKAEETNIEVEISALNSLANAVHVFIDRYEPPTALSEQIRDCNAQTRIA